MKDMSEKPASDRRPVCTWFSILALTVILSAPTTAYTPDTLTVTFLDVGEADAAIVQAPNGHMMLVEAGRQGNAVTASDALAAEGIEWLDYVVGTHEDADHIGGMVPVLSYMAVGEYVNNGVEDPDPSDTTLFLRTYLASRGITPRAAEAGDTLALDPANVTVTVLNPPADPGSDDNEGSVVLRLVYGSQSFLLAGDAEQAAEGWMIASGRPLASRILKVGHHGGATATSAGFVAAVDPEIAIISVGPNAYGHPSQAVVKRLEDSGATVYSTGASGTVQNPVHTYTAAGTNAVTLTAMGASGSVDTSTATIVVTAPVETEKTPSEALSDLKTQVKSLKLPGGVENGFTSKLDAALKALEKGNRKTAINNLNAFINHAQAQRGKKVTAAQADALIAGAQ